MPPFGDRCAGCCALLEHDERVVAQGELGGGGKPNRAGADDRYGKCFESGFGCVHDVSAQARTFWRDFAGRLAGAASGVTPLQQFSCRYAISASMHSKLTV